MKHWIIAGSILGAVGLGAQAASVNPIVNPPVRIVGLEAQDTHAAASLLGQFRTSISSFLYLRADLYVHNGVEMRPLTSQEEKRGRVGAQQAIDEAEKLDGDAAIVTVIPSEKEDFRGMFGDVEREVASYKDMAGHHHQSPTQTLPLFRLMTWIDPQFIDAWTSAGQIILWENKPGSTDLAVDFLKHGHNQNPQSIDIMSEMAYCYLRSKEVDPENPDAKYQKALPYLEEGKRIGMDHLKELSKKEGESLEENFRRLSVCYRELKQFDKMRENSALGLEIFGQDASLRTALQEANKYIK